MGKFDGYLLATDLDGTLLGTDKKVSDENAAAIRRFQSEGGLFTVATGRYPQFLDSYFHLFDINECVVALNGNMIYDLKTRSIRFISKIDRSSLTEVLNCAMRFFNSDIYLIEISDEIESNIYSGNIARDVCRSMIVASCAKAAIAIRNFLNSVYGSDFTILRSWEAGVEIYKKGSGKGECIEFIRKNINPTIKKTICVGDYENDVTMLTFADIGYAVKNASESAKKAANRITLADNDHSAIAWVINDLEKEV